MSDRVIWLIGIGTCLGWLVLADSLEGWMRAAGLADELRPYAQGVLPALAAFIVAGFGGRTGWFKALLLILVMAIAATLANFVAWALGSPTDFPGLAGAPHIFTMMIVITTAMVVPGVVAGVIVKHVVLRRPRS